MINLVDKPMLKNIIKYYSTEGVGEFDNPPNVNGKILSINGFNALSIDMEDNLMIWQKNKSEIFKLFGNQLKISVPLDNITHSAAAVRVLLKEFIEENEKDLNLLIITFLSSLANNYMDSIIDNKLIVKIKILDIVLEKGWKISRCFKMLELDSIKLDKVQTLYSQFLQKLKIKGKLVLSIDPIDFITMSCNKSGWTSCHHPNGCYGTGCMSYMNDKHTIISYVTTENDYKFNVFDPESDLNTEIKFSDKLWRQISYINSELDYAIQAREYPNTSYVYSKEVTTVLKKLFIDRKPELEFNDIVRDVEHLSLWNLQRSNPLLRRKMFYNDIENTSFNNAIIIYPSHYGEDTKELENIIKTDKDKFYITVGEKFYCACGCGKVNFTRRFLYEDGTNYEYEDDYDEFEEERLVEDELVEPQPPVEVQYQPVGLQSTLEHINPTINYMNIPNIGVATRSPIYNIDWIV